MANIKVSEMTEATSFDDGDYTMIVQANQNKKITKENMLINIGDISNLETTNKSDVVNSINEVNSIATNNAKNKIYSLNETDTGKIWANGKKIFRKAFSFTQWGGLGYNTELEDIEDIIDSTVLLKNTEKDAWLKLAYNQDSYFGYYIKKTGNTYKIFIQNNSVYTASSVCGWIEYTKTTD